MPPGNNLVFPTLVLTNGTPFAIASIIEIENSSKRLPTKYKVAFDNISGISSRATSDKKMCSFYLKLLDNISGISSRATSDKKNTSFLP